MIKKTKEQWGMFLTNLAKKFPKDKKDKIIRAFAEKHKDNPLKDHMIVELKTMIEYDEEDKTESRRD